ncbi:MAG: hypothetical protein JJ971_10630 [Balneolaceae bacterium]|nr:hypothetical protein [Balneolaceae bacterium]MBO6546299.1 hypothetical protein [Balneolaceae bacterium]MBO6648658.1 hypothetical protein [Balneolaceae bacterium]
MKISKTYRVLARLISATLFFGAISPVVLQASMLAHCETMMEISDATESSMHGHDSMSHSSMEINPIMDMNTEEDCSMTAELMDQDQTNKEERSVLTHCEMSIDCDCDLTYQAVHKKALVLQQLKVPILSTSFFETDLLEDHPDPSPVPIYFSNSYSPPLLFLANESLLI